MDGKIKTRHAAEYRQQMVDLGRFGRSPDHLDREFEPSAESICIGVAEADCNGGSRVAAA